MLYVLQITAAVATIVTGLVSLLRPRSVTGFTGLELPGPRGVTEVRAILGGGFVGLGVAPLILGPGSAYAMLGITYLVIAAARGLSMVVDGSAVRSNWISLAVEIAFGVLLVL